MSALADALTEARRELAAQWAREEEGMRFQNDLAAYCTEVLRFHPWSKQREILDSLVRHKRTAVRSCHGVGKTAIAARAALSFLVTRPGKTRVITTAPTWSQVETLLWKEIHAAYHAAGSIGGKLSATRLDLGPEWFAIGWSTDRPERFQGQHADHLLLIVDESSGVDEGIFEAAQGFLTAEGARLLLIGNPTQVTGEFYDAFHGKRAAYNTIAISVFDTPAFSGEQVPAAVLRALPTQEWVEEMRELYGEASPLWEVRVLGQFPSLADDTVISLGDLESAHWRRCEPETPVVLACDVARFGSDETVLAVRNGRQVRIAETLQGRDTMEVVGAIIRQARKIGHERRDWPAIVIDDVGVGGGVTDRLRELQAEGVLNQIVKIIPFNGGAPARQKDDYPNRRSELWFQFAEQLAELDLEPDERLAADLLAPRYKLDSPGRRVVEPKADTKKRLGRSPDRADAVLMCFAPDRRSSNYIFDPDEDEADEFSETRMAYGMHL